MCLIELSIASLLTLVFITIWGKSTINLMKNETLIMFCTLQKLAYFAVKKNMTTLKGDKAPDFQD
jgi:hypothetical protein